MTSTTITVAQDKRIEEIRDERDEGGDYFVYLKPGYAFSDPPQHCFGAINKTEIRETMRRVRSCGCGDCPALAKAGA